VPSRLAKFFALVAAVQILGGHWMLLQSAAWVGMVIDFSHHESLPVAIEKTFDGEHPCDLCKTVSKGRGDEQQREQAKLTLKFEAVLGSPLSLPAPAAQPWLYPSGCAEWIALTAAPPTPPPLAA
jgi:hypothetical protein